ncbi:hypothetical protein [Herbaspirillum seropedicae]|nr:hypothetical protein [Herbaspirillum seropedicae]
MAIIELPILALMPAMVCYLVTQISKFHSWGYNAVRNARGYYF